jgi:hypothetical protein
MCSRIFIGQLQVASHSQKKVGAESQTGTFVDHDTLPADMGDDYGKCTVFLLKFFLTISVDMQSADVFPPGAKDAKGN